MSDLSDRYRRRAEQNDILGRHSVADKELFDLGARALEALEKIQERSLQYQKANGSVGMIVREVLDDARRELEREGAK